MKVKKKFVPSVLYRRIWSSFPKWFTNKINDKIIEDLNRNNNLNVIHKRWEVSAGRV